MMNNNTTRKGEKNEKNIRKRKDYVMKIDYKKVLNRKQKVIPGTWADVKQKYNTEQKCEKLFLSHLWPDGIRCPKCGYSNPITNKIHTGIQKYSVEFKCAQCHKKITENTNCIFTDSPHTFQTLLDAVYFIAIKEKSTSSSQLQDILGIYQSSAWDLILRISQLADKQDITLDGTVEMDEWYDNSNPIYKHNYQQSIYGNDKGIIGESVPIVGGTQRAITDIDKNGKKIIIQPAQYVLKRLKLRGDRSVASQHILEFRNQYIPNHENVNFLTDDAKIYTTNGLLKHHKAVKHNVKNDETETSQTTIETDNNNQNETKQEKIPHHAKFVDEDGNHTNNVEGLFSRISKYKKGTHNLLSPKYEQMYLNMQIFRENNRHLTTEEKIHKYLSYLPRVPHVNIDDLVGDEPTGFFSQKTRFAVKQHPNLIKELNDVPIEKVIYRNDFLKMVQDIGMNLAGPKAKKTLEKLFMQQAMQQVLPEFIELAKNMDEATQTEFYQHILNELTEIPWDERYWFVNNDLQNRLDIGDIIYTDKNVPGEPEQFKQRMTARKQRENAKKRRKEKKENEKKNSEKISKNRCLPIKNSGRL